MQDDIAYVSAAFLRNRTLYMAYRRTPIDFVKYELEINSDHTMLTGITFAVMQHNNSIHLNLKSTFVMQGVK